MQILEGRVSELPTKIEALQQRTDLLEKIFLFVDIDVLNKAIATTTCHKCGPPALIPACQAQALGLSFMDTKCGGPTGTRLGNIEPTDEAKPPQLPLLASVAEAYPEVIPSPMPSPRAIGGSGNDLEVQSSIVNGDSPLSSRITHPDNAQVCTDIVDQCKCLVCQSLVCHCWAPAESLEPLPSPLAISDEDAPVTLISATDAGRLDIVAQLLEGGADPNIRSAEDETALHRAAYWAKKDIVEVLLDAKADPSVRDRKGKTPMRKSYDNPDILGLLLKAGADANAVDESGRTTLHRSAENGHLDAIDVLVRAGADPNIGNTEQETPLHEAANFGQTGALQALLNARGSINAQDTYGNTPLHFAAYGGHACIAKLLVDCRADVHIVNNDDESPLKCAEQSRKAEVVDVLRCSMLPDDAKANVIKVATDEMPLKSKVELADTAFVPSN